jgi:glycosyltransferase involved in cell wall biosynthesis
VEQLGARLAGRGYPVTVYNRDPYYKTLRQEWKGMKIVWLPTIPTKSLDTIVHTSLSLVHALFCRYDIIYLCGVGNAPLSRLVKWCSHSKVIINVDGADFRRKKWGPFARVWLRTSEKQAVELADAVIADNMEVVRRYEKSYGRTPTYLSYGANTKGTGGDYPGDVKEAASGSDVMKPAFVDPVPDENELNTWGLEVEGYFLYVSRLTPENEADLALKAYDLFRQSKIKNQKSEMTLPKLVIVGSARYEEDYYRRLLELTVEGVVFTGARFGRAYEELSQHAIGFLMPATIEATRLVLLDQLAFGSAVLYRDCAATREVLGDQGMAFDGEDPVSDLAKKMQILWMDGDVRKRLKQGAQERALEKFNWETVVDAYEKLFQSFS